MSGKRNPTPEAAMVERLRQRVVKWEATGGYARVTVPLRELQAALAASPPPVAGGEGAKHALIEMREGIVAGLTAFCGSTPDIDLSSRLKNDAADYILAQSGLFALATPATGGTDQHADDIAVDRFAVRMKAKLAAARAKGRGGWNDPAQCSPPILSEMLHGHVAKGDPIDVANFAMMIEHYGASISPATVGIFADRVDNEAIARIIDPEEWALDDIAKTRGTRAMFIHKSLEKVAAIRALQPGAEPLL